MNWLFFVAFYILHEIFKFPLIFLELEFLKTHSFRVDLSESRKTLPLRKKKTFPLKISSVNVTKSAGNWGSGHSY